MSFLLNLIIAMDTSKTLWTTSIIIELKILEYGTGSSKKLLQDAIWVVNKKGLIFWKTETSIDPIIVNKIITAIVETIGPIEFSAKAEKQIDTEETAHISPQRMSLIARKVGNDVDVLMNELSKIKRVMEKVVPGAPHEILLVLDGSTGQNAYEQAKQFAQATEINALAITKLDGTAKGGVVIGISDQMQIPVKYIGVGEKMEDLQLFDKQAFVDALFSETAG